MNDNDITTLEQVRRFLEGTEVVDFAIKEKKERYEWIQRTLVRLGIWSVNKKNKSPILCNRKVLKDHEVVNHGSQRFEIEGLQPLKGSCGRTLENDEFEITT